jgi:3-hydroxyacyl-[acyl-carrier-protein] dehydratase
MYFRFNKLKCEVEMRNSENKLIANGTISGMIKAGG